LLPWQNPFGKGENRVSPVGARERQGFICKAIVAKKDILYIRDKIAASNRKCGGCLLLALQSQFSGALG
jgi:hypothetical protein